MKQVVKPGSQLRWWHPWDLSIAQHVGTSLRVLGVWVALSALSVALGLASVGWAGIPLRVGPVAVDLSFYPPLTLCLLLTLWLGPWWGIVPAYLTSLGLSLHDGMPPATSAVFAFATPIALMVLWSLMVKLEVSPSLRTLPDILRFAILSLVATGASSVGALVWNVHHGLRFSRAIAVWQGWVLGDFVQIVLLVGPLLFLLDERVRRWLTARLPFEPRTGLDNRFFVAVFALVLLTMIAIGATATWHFLSSPPFSLGAESVSLSALRQALWAGTVFLGVYALVFVASVLVFSSTLGRQIDRHLSDIAERQRIQEEKEKLIAQLQQALAEVRVLSGLVPICAHCKKIRDDTGYWNQIEAYLRERSALQFSHGICPDCRRTQYPEYPPT